jgi:hypothetical protein
MLKLAKFQVHTAAGMKLTARWDVTLCTLIEIYRRFRACYSLHLWYDEGLIVVVKFLREYTPSIL